MHAFWQGPGPAPLLHASPPHHHHSMPPTPRNPCVQRARGWPASSSCHHSCPDAQLPTEAPSRPLLGGHPGRAGCPCSHPKLITAPSSDSCQSESRLGSCETNSCTPPNITAHALQAHRAQQGHRGQGARLRCGGPGIAEELAVGSRCLPALAGWHPQ